MGFLVVFLGAGFGGMARHGLGLVMLRALGPGFPWGTLLINIVGSGLMGLFVTIFAFMHVGHPETRLFLTTGVLGGFTTFSTFSLDTVALWQRGQHGMAALYVAASIAVSLAALAGAMVLIRRLA